MSDLSLKQAMVKLSIRDYRTLKRWMVRAQVTARQLDYGTLDHEDKGRVWLLSEEEVDQVGACRAQFLAYNEPARARAVLALPAPAPLAVGESVPLAARTYHSPVTRPLARGELSWQRASFTESAHRHLPFGHVTLAEFCRLHNLPTRTARNKIDNGQLSEGRGEIYKMTVAGTETWILPPLGQARSFQFWGGGRHLEWRNCPECPHVVPAPNREEEASDVS